jgi:hypothetical protein
MSKEELEVARVPLLVPERPQARRPQESEKLSLALAGWHVVMMTATTRDRE